MVPECRKTLDKIDRKLITDLGFDGAPMKITFTFGTETKDYQLFRFVDPWGEPLRYDYYDETEADFGKKRESERAFPVITSAGPDKDPNTVADNIASR
jgi:hypothetical protein